VTQTVSDLAPWDIIKKSAHRLTSFINFFVVSDGWLTLTFVGMVKLVAICGIGSALWAWSKRSKGKAESSSADPEHSEAVGKQAQAMCDISAISRGPTRMRRGRLEVTANDCQMMLSLPTLGY
jgi:hypothetical protein